MREDLIRERIAKGEIFARKNLPRYPASVTRSHRIAEVLSAFGPLTKAKTRVSVCGRLFGMRNQGSLFFADLKDESGGIQLVAKKESLKEFRLFRDHLDIGDFVQASGNPFITKRGEKSIEVRQLRLIAKTIRPIPSERFGIEDVETRLRKRYLEILTNPETKEMFRKKSAFWNAFRAELVNLGFLEVETPVLEQIPGGAEAEPFVTHHNALDQNFYLRISLELPLKKLLVAGYEKVFEIGRIFRNEGIDAEHLQDYTQLEFYWAYEDYRSTMKLVEKLYKKAIKASTGTLTTRWRGQKVNWGKRWEVIDYYAIFKKELGIDLAKATTEDLLLKARNAGLVPEKNSGRGRVIDKLFKLIRPKLVQPVFLIDPPVEIEPLAKRHEDDPRRVYRFQVIACGTELGKGFSELNDPLDQRKRFEEQMKLREAGDKEAQRLDEEFLEAMEYGMPPAGGFGVSERFFAVLMDKPVRETVIFPLMRIKK